MFRSALFIFFAALLTACNPSDSNMTDNNASDSASRNVGDLKKMATNTPPISGQRPANPGPSIMAVDTPPIGGQLPADLMPPS